MDNICRGTNVRYTARVRLPYQRNWQMLMVRQSLNLALADLAREMGCWSRYTRGDVIMTADYYDPVVVMEMRRLQRSDK